MEGTDCELAGAVDARHSAAAEAQLVAASISAKTGLAFDAAPRLVEDLRPWTVAGGLDAGQGASLSAMGVRAKASPFSATSLAELLRGNEDRRGNAGVLTNAAAAFDEVGKRAAVAGGPARAVVAARESANEPAIASAPEAPRPGALAAKRGIAGAVCRFAFFLLEGPASAIGAFARAAVDGETGVAIPMPSCGFVAKKHRAVHGARIVGGAVAWRSSVEAGACIESGTSIEAGPCVKNECIHRRGIHAGVGGVGGVAHPGVKTPGVPDDAEEKRGKMSRAR